MLHVSKHTCTQLKMKAAQIRPKMNVAMTKMNVASITRMLVLCYHMYLYTI